MVLVIRLRRAKGRHGWLITFESNRNGQFELKPNLKAFQVPTSKFKQSSFYFDRNNNCHFFLLKFHESNSEKVIMKKLYVTNFTYLQVMDRPSSSCGQEIIAIADDAMT